MIIILTKYCIENQIELKMNTVIACVRNLINFDVIISAKMLKPHCKENI